MLIITMDHLLNSRIEHPESPLHLDGLSPEKFGRGAYANLSYTPSKLAGNVLFREASSMRRAEEGSSKAREWEALHELLLERLRHLQEEKEGVEQGAAQQIAMYKRMLGEMEKASEKRVRALQAHFSEEVHKMILAKEEEARYVQSEKELLENRIYELEEHIAALKGELDALAQTLKQADKAQRELKHHKQQLEGKLKEEVQARQKEREEFGKQRERAEGEFKRSLEDKEREHAKKIQQFNLQKQQIINQISRTHEKQLQQRQAQLRAREQEMRNMKAGFEGERKRLEQSLREKEQMVHQLTNTLKEESDKYTNTIRRQEKEMATMTLERQKLMQDAQTSAREAAASKSSSTQTTANLQASMDKLRRELEGVLKERQGLAYENEDMRREVLILRKSVEKTSYVVEENAVLSREVKALKELLMESSLEMERCKGEFLRLSQEKDLLVGKMGELDLENETLYRIKLEMEEEARVWRETYYTARR